MVRKQDRIDDVENLEQAYEDLRQLDEKYDADFSQPAELVEDVLSEEPDQSVTMSYRQAYISIEEAEEEADIEREDRQVLTGVKQALQDEEDGFPAMGTGRHYSLDERRKNL